MLMLQTICPFLDTSNIAPLQWICQIALPRAREDQSPRTKQFGVILCMGTMMYSPLCLNAKEMLNPTSTCCTSLYILFLGDATDQNHSLCFINENILQLLGFPLKGGFLCNWPCSNADQGGKVSSRAGRVCSPGWQVAYTVTCGSGLLVKRGMARELKQIPRISALPWQSLWLCALGIVTKKHASAFRDRNGHLSHKGHRQGRALPWPCSSGIPGSHGSGNCTCCCRHSRGAASHRSIALKDAVRHFMRFCLLCHVLCHWKIMFCEKKKESEDFWFCIFHSGRKIPGKARK